MLCVQTVSENCCIVYLLNITFSTYPEYTVYHDIIKLFIFKKNAVISLILRSGMSIGDIL